MTERLPNIGIERASRTSEKMRLYKEYKEEKKKMTRIPAPTAAAGALALGALVVTAVLLLLLGPVFLMWATDLLHNTYPVVPELSFVNSLLTIIIARILVGGRSTFSSTTK